MHPVSIPIAASMLVIGISGSAWASSAFVSSNSLGSGGAQVGRCDTAVDFEFDVVQSSTGSFVSHVRLLGVDGACHGGRANLILADSAGQALGSVTETTLVVSGGTARVALSTQPAADKVKAVYMVVNS